MSRYILHGKNGFTLAYGEDKNLGHFLDLLISDMKLRNSMSINARSIYPLLSWKSIAKDYINKYPLKTVRKY